MEFAKRLLPNGEYSKKYYLRRRTCKKIFRDLWLIKADKKRGYISASHKINFPEELIGKKVKIVLKILEEKEKNGFQEKK